MRLHCRYGWLTQTNTYISSACLSSGLLGFVHILAPTYVWNTQRFQQFWVTVCEILLLSWMLLYLFKDIFNKTLLNKWNLKGMCNKQAFKELHIVYWLKIPSWGEQSIFLIFDESSRLKECQRQSLAWGFVLYVMWRPCEIGRDFWCLSFFSLLFYTGLFMRFNKKLLRGGYVAVCFSVCVRTLYWHVVSALVCQLDWAPAQCIFT